MTTDTDSIFTPALPVVNPHRYIYTPSLEFASRKHSDGTVVSDWPIHHVFGNFRLYVKPKEVDGEYEAFSFVLLGLLRRTEDDQPGYDNPTSLVREVCNGYCNGEGIRYCYFGDPLLGGSGLVENIDLKALSEALVFVAMYQKKWCSE